LIGFKENINILVKLIEFLIMIPIILSNRLFLTKKNNNFHQVIDESNKNNKPIDNCFYNYKDGIIILEKDGKINYNNKYLKLIQNINNDNFLSNLKYNYFYQKKNEITNTISGKDKDFCKSDLFHILIKINIFNKIDTYNQNLTDYLIELIQNFNEEIFNFKISLKDEVRKNYNFENIFKMENEKSGSKKNSNLFSSKINESINPLILQNELNKENKCLYSNLNNKNSNFNDNSNLNVENDNLKTINKDYNQKIKNFCPSNVFTIKECLEKETFKNNSLKSKRKLGEIINKNEYNEDILLKINKCFDDFVIDLKFYYKENNKFDYILIGERLIEDERYSNEDKFNDEQINSKFKNKILNSVLLNNISAEHIEKEINKNIHKQNMFIRFNKIDESLEIIFQNIETIKDIESKADKNINENKNLFEKNFSNILMKICHEIKNPILNIIELTKEIKQINYFKDEKTEINQKERYLNIKNIKYIANSINFVISDLEFLTDIIRCYDNPEEITNKIKTKMIRREGIFYLTKEIEKLKKIFQFKINSSKKEIHITSSYENIPKNIKLDGSIFLSCIFNILSNSFKFSANGVISIDMSFNNIEKKLCIEISDQGIGIKKENLSKLGHLFYKTENRNNNYGLGMGLFTVKMITESINGTLRIISDYGKGTCISIELPLIEENINSAYVKRNKEKIFKLFINSFPTEKNAEIKISPKNLFQRKDKFGFSTSLSNYVNYLNSKYFSTCILSSKNSIKKKRLLSSSSLKIKLASFMRNKTKNSEKKITRSKTQFSNFKSEGHIKKKFKSYSSDKNNQESSNKFYRNFESSSDNKIDNINFRKPTNINNSNLSSIDEKSTIRNSNILPIENNLIESIYCLNDSFINKNITNNRKIKNFENFTNINFIDNKTFNRDKNMSFKFNNNEIPETGIIYNFKSSKNVKELNGILVNEKSKLYRKESNNNLDNNLQENKINIEKTNDSPSYRINDLHSGRDCSTRLRTDNFLNINYKDVNLKFDNKSLISSEYNKTEELDKMIKTYILDNSIDSNSLNFNLELRILVVDDEDLIRRSHVNIIKKYCKKEKLNVIIEEACDGADCLYKLYLGFLKGIKYDLILTDETMNFMNGGFTAKIIKSLIEGNILQDIKIILITSYEINIIEKSKSCEGIDHVYNKPLNDNTLENIFLKCLDN